MKRIQKCKGLLAMLLTAIIAVSALLPAAAAEPNTPKEEVVYVSLNADGSVKEIYVVNIFDLDEDGQIIDYGRYESLRNMTTTDEIGYLDNTVTIDAKAGKLYYEGKLKETVMPWSISIRYFMDGTEYPAEQLAGRSGALKITVQVSRNPECEGEFFENYALQASLTLDADRCRNISAPEATVANAGGKKQLTYTILPGMGADVEIRADVEDFETDGFSLNGIPLKLGLEFDGDTVTEGVAELSDALAELETGAATLGDGCSSLEDGAAELQTGAAALDSGIMELHQGIEQMRTALSALDRASSALTEGSAEFRTALVRLQSALGGVSLSAQDLSALSEASSSIKKAIAELADGASALEQNVSWEQYQALLRQNGLDPDALRQNNTAAANGLKQQADELRKQLAALQSAGQDVSALEAQIAQLENTAELLLANNAAMNGTQSYLSSVRQSLGTLSDGAERLRAGYAAFDAQMSELISALLTLSERLGALSEALNALAAEYAKLDSGLNEYTDGVSALADGYRQISDGAARLLDGSSALKLGSDRLYEGITQLSGGTDELKNGASAIREETSGMSEEIDEKLGTLLNGLSGDASEVSSFVSAQNENVKSVQFVIKTEGIHPAEPEKAPEEEPAKLSFWQKLLKLFGLYHED